MGFYNLTLEGKVIVSSFFNVPDDDEVGLYKEISTFVAFPFKPTQRPTPTPTFSPSQLPTAAPSMVPSASPTSNPTTILPTPMPVVVVSGGDRRLTASLPLSGPGRRLETFSWSVTVEVVTTLSQVGLEEPYEVVNMVHAKLEEPAFRAALVTAFIRTLEEE